jgi:DNA-directed RNA polymerase subunit H (RpoH/RPB5)
MAMKQNSSNTKKKGEITRIERNSVNQQAELVLKEIKERTGDVVRITISDRTTIELPAHLSQEERDARVAKYIKLHNSKI